ncbi:unnamed protein product [Rhodiola kirilowii]
MAGLKWEIVRSMVTIGCSFAMASLLVSAERGLRMERPVQKSDFILESLEFLWQSDKSGYQHIWPELKFGWQIVWGAQSGFSEQHLEV